VTKGDDIIATFGPGDFFGEAAIFKTTRRTATVTAASPVTVLAMFGADFARLSDEIPELKKRIDATIAQRLPPTSSP
jgi:CRP-like cAMP-binding protein